MYLNKSLISAVVINSNMSVGGIFWLAVTIVLFFLIDYSKLKNLGHGSGSLSSFSSWSHVF